MATRVMACPNCGLRVETDFRENEFSHLEDEWLHFLRIFIHCEGRIRDIEAALGISYPTVKARIAELKHRLGMTEVETIPPENPGESVKEILDLLESGKIDYDEAMIRLKARE